VPDLAASRKAGIVRRRTGWLSPAATAVVEELRRICAAEPRN
jgi:LysR family transcriptional regulator of gallate degradation